MLMLLVTTGPWPVDETDDKIVPVLLQVRD